MHGPPDKENQLSEEKSKRSGGTECHRKILPLTAGEGKARWLPTTIEKITCQKKPATGERIFPALVGSPSTRSTSERGRKKKRSQYFGDIKKKKKLVVHQREKNSGDSEPPRRGGKINQQKRKRKKGRDRPFGGGGSFTSGEKKKELTLSGRERKKKTC